MLELEGLPLQYNLYTTLLRVFTDFNTFNNFVFSGQTTQHYYIFIKVLLPLNKFILMSQRKPLKPISRSSLFGRYIITCRHEQ